MNAAGCSATGDLARLHETFMTLLVERIEAAAPAGAAPDGDR